MKQSSLKHAISYIPIEVDSSQRKGLLKAITFPSFIIIAFCLLLLGALLNFMADQKEAPDSEDFSFEGYQEALEEYNDSVATLQATSTLFMLCGTIGLGAGLFFYAAEASSHLPDYTRAALMLGAMYFLVRMATSEISIVDMLTLFGTLS